MSLLAQTIMLLLPLLAQTGPADEAANTDPVQAALDGLSDKERQKLNNGKVIFVSRSETAEEGADAGIGWAIGIIHATPERVWEVLVDFEQYPEYMPRVEAVESYKLENDSERFGLKFTLGILFQDTVYHIRQRNDAAAHTVTWEKDPDKEDDFTKNSGQWVLRPLGEDATLAFYTVDVVTTRRIPKAIQDFLLKRDLPDVVEALRDRVENTD